MSCAVGLSSTFVVNEDGELFSWGFNQHSALGLLGAWPEVRDVEFTTIPTQIRDVGKGVQMVTANQSRAACVMQDGTVFLWGQGNKFPFPHVADTAGRDRPLIHVRHHDLEGERATQVACNKYGWTIVTDTGSVFVGMFNDTPVGPHGHIDNTDEAMQFASDSGLLFFRQIRPTVRLQQQVFGNMPIKMVAAGESHMLASGVFHGLWSWGANIQGCLGHGLGQELHTSTPTPVPAFHTHRVTWVAAGSFTSMAISAGSSGVTGVPRDDAGVYGWGRNLAGELGVGYEEGPSYMAQHEYQLRLQPVRISPAAFDDETIIMVACGPHCTAAISDTGKMWLFGYTARMANYTWSRQHALHSRGINVQTGRGRARDAVQGAGGGDGAGSDASNSSSDFSYSSDDSADEENRTDRRGTPFETKYVHKPVPARVQQRHFLGAKIVAVAAGDSHLAATTEDGHLYMFYAGIIPVLYRPYCTPLDDMYTEPVPALQKQLFGGKPLAVRGAWGPTHMFGMSRRDVALYAHGHFRSSSQYRAHTTSTRTRQQQMWAKQQAAGAAASTASTAADCTHWPS